LILYREPAPVEDLVIRRVRLTLREPCAAVSVDVLPICDPIRHVAAANHPSSRTGHHGIVERILHESAELPRELDQDSLLSPRSWSGVPGAMLTSRSRVSMPGDRAERATQHH